MRELLVIVFALAPATMKPLELSLLPPEHCAGAADVRQCEVARPQEWSAADREIMRDAIDRLTAHELVQGLLVGAYENGYSGLRRYATDTRQDPTYGAVPKFNPGFVLFRSKVIGITDAFFQTAQVTDAMSDYRVSDLFLIHELVHAFDDRRRSNDAGFTALAGWVFRNDRWQYTHRVSVSAYMSVFADTLMLNARGEYGEAWVRDRSFATSLPFPLPTIQSLASPAESFADILAHLIVDPKAKTYLKPQVVIWFERHVFPELREKARQARMGEA